MHPFRSTVLGTVVLLLAAAAAPAEDKLTIVPEVDAQPLRAQVRRIVQALEFVGAPLSEQVREQLAAASQADDAVTKIQEVLDPLCLVEVHINPEARVKVAPGPVNRELTQQGWTVFLVKVHNEAHVTATLRCTSPHAAPMHQRSTGSPAPRPSITPQQAEDRWMDVGMFDRQPLEGKLSGLRVEYRIVEIFSRDIGRREAKLVFDAGQGTQDLGFRNEVNLLFESRPAVEVVLEVLDHDGQPSTGQFVFRDSRGRVYPSRTRRMAPDFFFHDQVYRHHGEAVMLPPGKYDVTFTRGPEYVIERRTITVPEDKRHVEHFQLKRWIKLVDHGWFSGDHHVHAAGCAHYEAPTEGVTPEDMMRHILGEDLNVGCVLSWGPCWYFQKQFFQGKVHALSTPRYVMRYDVEVSGFPSSHAGHLCLLRLVDDDYPGTERLEQWPSWNQPILQWGKRQGGVVGYSHSGWGLAVPDEQLPSFAMPKFDGIGANEFIVNVTQDACDFISAVDTPIIWELSIWYHTLNCGFTGRISGETDFPCIYGERVGLGRSYVKLDPNKPVDFDQWAQGIRDGRSYVSEGLTHLFDFQVGELAVGEPGAGGRASVLAAKAGEKLRVKVRAAALLEEQPREDIRRRALSEKPYWHVERARIGEGRKVPVELVVNGQAVARREIEANGSIQDVEFDYTPERSSWVAVRVFPAAHTNPIFVEVDGKPIRASRRSAQWCLEAVDVCWQSKSPRIRAEEREAAMAAYETARRAYRKVLEESEP
jgi:hypothetical protein